MSSRTGTYTIGIAASSIVAGFFYLDVSAIDGTDGLYDGNSDQFGGTYTDCSADVDGPIQITMGTSNLGGAVQASTCDFTLCNPLDPGYYNPANPTSTLNLMSPGFKEMRPVKVTCTVDAVTYGLFLGFIMSATYDLVNMDCRIHCEDALMWLDRVFPVIAATGPTTTGAAIGRVLDAAGLTDPVYRSLATGDTIATFSSDGTQSGLQLIAGLLTGERGTVRVNGTGVIVYEDRGQARSHAVKGAYTTQQFAGSAGLDLSRIVNQWTVTRSGGVAQVASDVTSQNRYGRADSSISTAYLPDDATALLLAQDLVLTTAAPAPPVTLEADNQDGATFLLLLTTGLLDLLTANETLSGTNGTYRVDQIQVTVVAQGARHSCHYLLKQLNAVDIPFRVDISALDGTDALRY